MAYTRDLILLHGALGAKSQLAPFKSLVEPYFSCHRLNFYGHGSMTDSGRPFSIEDFARELDIFIRERGLDKPVIFGYSMGGYIALYLARTQPELTGPIITLGTKLQWDPDTAEREMQMLNPDKIEAKVPAFAKALKERHQPGNWKEVARKTADMLYQMGQNPPLQTDDFRAIQTPVHFLLGDQDHMVSREETHNASRLISGSSFTIIEDSKHPIEQADLKQVMDVVKGSAKTV